MNARLVLNLARNARISAITMLNTRCAKVYLVIHELITRSQKFILLSASGSRIEFTKLKCLLLSTVDSRIDFTTSRSIHF